MQIKIQELFQNINDEYSINYEFKEEKLTERMIQVQNAFLNIIKKKEIIFVSGKGKRPTLIQKQFQELSGYIKRQKQYDEKKVTLKGRNSYSKTDTDATFMRMKDDHMKNGQLKPAYNIQIAVESEYVTGVGVFGDANDLNTLKPMLNNMEKCSGHQYKNIVADSGYESEENYTYLEQKGQTAYIKPQNYERKKDKKYKNDISKRENMIYCIEKDEYTCANNKILRCIATKKRKSKTGFQSEISIYECDSCHECLMKNSCTKAIGNKKMEASKEFLRLRDFSHNCITSELGIILRLNRSIQVEGAFGVLKSDYQFNRFLTTGKNSVKNEFLLLCFGYYINKLHNKIQNNRQHIHLHKEKEAA